MTVISDDTADTSADTADTARDGFAPPPGLGPERFVAPERSVGASDESGSAGFRRRRLGLAGWIGAALLLVVAGATTFAPWITPAGPFDQELTALLRPPSGEHWFGTDELGRDLFTRVVYGGRTALLVTVVASAISSALGLFLAVAGALYGGWVDALGGRLADVQLAIPTIVLAIVILSFVGNSFVPLVTVLVLGSWVLTFRTIRGQARAIIKQPYIEAARVSGAGRFDLAWRHLLPSVLPIYFVALTLSASGILLLESSLGFLGLGVQPPEPDWGQMVSAGQARLSSAPWLSLFPGAVLIVTIVALQLLGDALADRFGLGARRKEAIR